MKRLLLAFLLLVGPIWADTTMQIRNGILTTNMDANNFTIINLQLPINPNDAANKAYVDSFIGGGGSPAVPPLTGHAGEFLTNNGSITLWSVIPWSAIDPAAKNVQYVTPDAAGRTAIGLVIGTNVQAWDADLDSLAVFNAAGLAYYKNTTNKWQAVIIGSGLTFDLSTGVLAATGGGGGGGEITSPSSPSPAYAANMLTVFADSTGDVITTANFTGVPFLTAGLLSTSAQLTVTAGGTGLGAISVGDILYGSATNVISRLSANSTATNKYLRSVSSGAPSWQQIQFSDILSTSIPAFLVSGNNLSDVGNVGTARSNLGLAIGTNVEAWDADLDALAAFGGIDNTGLAYRSAANTWSSVSFSGGVQFVGGVVSLSGSAANVISDLPGALPTPIPSIDGQMVIFTGTSGTHIRASNIGANTMIKTGSSNGVPGGAIPNIDYAKFAEGVFTVAGTSSTPRVWTGFATTMNEGASSGVSILNAIDGYAYLPPAANYAPGTIITYSDTVTVTNFGRYFSATNNGIDKMDGQPSGTFVRLFIAGGLTPGQGTYQWKTDGTANWTSVYSLARATKFQDPVDARKSVGVNVRVTPNSTWAFNLPDKDSWAVPDASPAPGQFVTGFSSGIPTTSAVGVHDLVSTQYDIDASKIVNVVGPPATHTATVPDDGTIDNVRLSVPLDGTNSPLTIIMPNMVNGYGAGEIIRFYDATGTIDTTRTVTLKGPPAPAPNPQTFNGNNTLVIQEAYAARALVADPATINWSTPTGQPAGNGGVGVQPFTNTSLVVAGTTATWTANAAFNNQNAKITLAANTNLVMTGFPDGMPFRLTVKQPLSGGPYALLLPTGSLTPSNGLGILYLSTGAGDVDTVEGYFDGTNYHFRATALKETASLISLCSTLDYNITSGTGTLKQGTNVNTLYFAGNFIAGGSGTYTLCRVTPWLQKVGAPTYNLVAEIWSNGKNAAFSDGVITVGTNTLGSTLGGFNSADVGKTVTGTNFTASPATTISSVAGGVATLNQPTIGTGTTGIAFTIVSRDVPNAKLGVTSPAIPSASLLVSRIGLLDVSITNASTTITTPSGSANTFSAADVGAPITGTGIPTTAIIASINNANSAELSVAATGTTGVVPSVTIFGARPISFTGLTASVTAGTKYWVVLYGDAVGGGSNQCAQVLAATLTGNSMLLSPGPPTTANLWLSSLGSSIPRMQTYH